MKSGYFERIAQKTKGNFRIKKENTIVQSSNRRDKYISTHGLIKIVKGKNEQYSIVSQNYLQPYTK